MNIRFSRRGMLKAGSASAVMAFWRPDIARGNLQDAKCGEGTNLSGVYDGTKYVLPELPYAYNALEPLYEQRTLEIHHTKHHAGYVKGLNSTLEKLEMVHKSGDYSSIKALSRDLAFHGSGHILHSLFWHSMKPGGSEVPKELAKAMSKEFGSVDSCLSHFVAATKSVEGSGWGILAYEPAGGKLLVLQAEMHQNLTIWGIIPLLACDVWEHAYYLQYANDRGSWVDNFMKLANWQFADERLAQAK